MCRKVTSCGPGLADEVALEQLLEACPRRRRRAPGPGRSTPASAKPRPKIEPTWRIRRSVGRQQVETREDGGLDRVRQALQRSLDRVRVELRADLLDDRPDDLAGVERVAVGALDHGLDDVGRDALDQVRDEGRDVDVGQRLERQRQRVAPAAAPRRSPIEQLRPGDRHDQDRQVGPGLDERVEEVEQAVARPVQVLEHDRQRARRSRPPRSPSARR